MKSIPSCRRSSRIARRRAAWHGWRRHECSEGPDERGFTLVELLIVVTVLPLVVGALSYGLLTVLQLQSGVQNRLSDTSDSQMVLADYTSDVQSATYITTQQGTTSQCGAGAQILGLKWGQSASAPYNFENVVSYVLQQFSGSSSYSLVRQYCTTTATGTAISSSMTYAATGGVGLVSSVILSNNFLPSSASTSSDFPAILPSSAATLASTSWVPASSVSSVTLNVTETVTSTQGVNSDGYSYTLVGAPLATSSGSVTGTPNVTSNNTTCGFATAGTGPYANNLCFIDFSSLTGARLAAAENYSATTGNCGLEMSSTLPGNYTMYFCLGISGVLDIGPFQLPTYGEAALGNDIYPSAYPFYIGIPGEPALYQTIKENNDTFVTFSNINVENQQGVTATGWQWFSADAESTDNTESIIWTSTSPMSSLGNGFPWDDQNSSDFDLTSKYGGTYSSPIGDACYGGLTFSSNFETITCTGQTPANATYGGATTAVLTGTAMIYGSGSELQVELKSPSPVNGLEGITFGAMTAGEGAR